MTNAAPTVRLTKTLGGYDYRIKNTTYHVSNNADGGGRGEWIIKVEADAYNYSDPISTLRECREALAYMETHPEEYGIK